MAHVLTRRTLLQLLPAAAALPRAMYAKAAAAPPQMFVGTGTEAKSSSKGIYLASWNPARGEVGDLALAAAMDSPTWLALGPGCRNLYASSEVSNGAVRAFKVGHDGGKLSLDLINFESTQGSGPAHVSVSPDGQSVFASNYGSGSLTSYKVESSGGLSTPVSHFQYTPVDDLAKHRHPHAHEATPTPDGNWLLVNDLGSDRIWIYRIDRPTATLTAAEPAFWQGRIGSGPRHLAIHPNHRWVYNCNESDSTVDHLLWDNKAGTLTTLGAFVSTLPPDYPPGTAFASEIIVSPDGRFLYVGNRRNESIARLDIDPSSGTVKLAQLIVHGGKTARHITLDPSGRFLLVACQDSGGIAVLSRDPKTGELAGPLHIYPIDSPQCLVFAN
jgi:6-phosphogluconolactonase